MSMSLRRLLFVFFFLKYTLALGTTAALYPAFNFNDWPQDIIEPLKKKFPELNQKSFKPEELNALLKNLQTEMNFDQLKIVQKNNQLYLVASISPKITQIEFNGLKSLDYDEALQLISITPQDANNEQKVSIAVDKLQSYYINSGFRKVNITTQVKKSSSAEQTLVFDIKLGPRTRIDKIEVQGLSQKEAEEIKRYFNWGGIGKILNETSLKNAHSTLRKALNKSGYYLSPVPTPIILFSADESSARLVYKVDPTQKYNIEFAGSSYSRSYIEDEILNLEQYSSTDENFGSDLADKIKSFYLEKGYMHVEVANSVSKNGEFININLDINEGAMVKIKTISITGNLSKPEKYYVEKFKSLSSSKTQDSILISEDIEQAAKNLIIFLQNDGFVNAKLSRLQVRTEGKKQEKGIIVLQIDEGPQAVINKIHITGNKYYSTSEIIRILDLNEGQKLSLIQLEKSLNNLKIKYTENGFIESKILSENKKLVQYSENLTEADINIDIYEGPQIRVDSIVIEGNSLTHTKVILTELEFKPGNLLTPSVLEESIARLQRTGHFSSVEIYTLEADTQVSNRTVVVRVAERKPGVFTSGVGVTNENDFTLQGYLGVAYRNIGGWGRGASARAEGKYNPDIIRFIESKITVGYLEPYLLDTRLRFRLNYTSSRSITDINIRKVTLTNQTVWSLEQDITSHITGIYEILNISNYVDRGIEREDELKHNYSREDMVISSTGPIIDIDYRDSVLNPQHGHWSRLSFEYASDALGNHNVDDFIKLAGQTTVYWTLQEKVGLVWANSYRAGYIKNIQDPKYGVAFDKEGFILGGRSTIRGFESGEFFPSTSQIGINYKIQNSSNYQLIKSELRFPLFKSESLSGAVFYDGGEVSVDNIPIKDKYRDSAGIGLRYNTPVGPLNLEYARKLDKKSYESDGAFHLSVGVF
ncbi:MAG: POTRA domain-containing protein [Pseudobdellovibrio sp.]